ncbi:putative amidase AmiB2 [Mycobacterium paraintracellulare]|uniref:amidase n=4 Tax=Mycobacteriaceae TaxID=1762 RepID=A0A7R7MUE8_MYCIT|nr:putative amidase AmiB2 [Mycobacterium paraintracellulare]BCO98796.1 putative amidase AmiB2 [Mycobacterium intracellulare]BCO40543.1 putative amidase AmiB2 [Mycobacterium paraintracellulare]BCO88208.1 putative amidase AmiB2 [Mycobacterium paraintracellulare]BCP03959.1 putative amidase AmiB2 [Mycobacterium paraintracellulare]
MLPRRGPADASPGPAQLRGYAAAVNDDLAFAGAAAQARMLADGELTAPELLEVYLERIAQLDSQLRCYRVVLADKARYEAAVAQDRLDAGERLPLLGVPVAIKDDVDVAGEVTTFGSGGHRPAVSSDAEVVRRLRAAGAVIVGKTNVPELMMLPYTESLTFGATRNPWDPRRTPGGSSGGSAAAVAAGLAPLALGSDGGGSIRIPATWCGVFGLKPQRDRVSLEPHDDAWYGLSVNGPIARTVIDAAVFLDATSTVPGPEGEFVSAATRSPGRLRIALSTKVPTPLPVRVGKRELAAVDEAGALLRDLGHDVITADPEYPASAILTNYLPRYLRGICDDADALAHPERLEPRTRNMARLGSFFSDRRMESLRAAEGAVVSRIQAIFDDVDVVVTPGTATGPSRIGAYQRRGAVSTLLRVGQYVPYQQVWNLTGQPAAVVPWDLDADGMPMSVQLVGRPYDEATLLSLSAQIEAARPWALRRPPVS